MDTTYASPGTSLILILVMVMNMRESHIPILALFAITQLIGLAWE
jgi:hypothetical protein